MRRAWLACVALAGCDPGCRGPRAAPDVVAPTPPARDLPAHCVAEARAASVAFPPGSGEVDGLSVGCAGGTLGVFALRGHVLSWTARADRTGASFSSPVVLATGADRLGPVAADAPMGPVAWRSPTAGLDATERDDLWAGMVLRADGGVETRRGDALLPAGYVGIGVPFARGAVAALSVVGTVAREGVGPMFVTAPVVLGRDEPTTLREPLAGPPGHIEAFEPRTDTTLARVRRGDESWLEARQGGRVVASARVTSPELVVLSRGEATPAGAVFAVGEFAVGRGDGGACVGQPGGLCVRPGRVTLWVVPPAGTMRVLEVAPRGVPDALAYDGDAVTVLYVEPGQEASAAQRAARIDVRSGATDSVDLTPPEGFPPIDSPRLARCGDALWLVAAVSLETRGVARAGVTAMPLACVLR